MTKTWSGVARRIRVPQAFAFAVVYLWLAQPTWLSIAIGAVIALAGVALRALASGHINKDSELTTSGPYAHTRNPLYVGSIIIAAGFAVAARSPWVVLVIIVVFAAIYVPVIRAEEDFLRTRFPAFDAYARHVPRFFPRLRPHPSPSGSFCWQRYRHHREYNALIGTAAMMAALAAKLLWPQR
jgi:protein-S-isoprenylcysteine O-methyltransferase Ste14